MPRSISEISPEWLTAALQSSDQVGHVVGHNEVVAYKSETIGADSGFASSIARLELKYNFAKCFGPTSMIVKLGTTSEDPQRSRILEDKYRQEAGFYADFWHHSRICTPECYFVAHQENPAGIVLLLQDLTGARFGDAAAGCSLEEAKIVVDSLADFHGGWWDDPQLSQSAWLPEFGNIPEQLERLSQRRAGFLERYGDILQREAVKLTNGLGGQHTALLAQLGGPPATLLHVDVHLDNLAFVNLASVCGERNDLQLLVFDWQGVSKGLCMVDVASFLSGAFVEPQTAAIEDLLVRYHRRLVNFGIDTYPWENCLLDFRVALLRWWIGTVNGLGSSYAVSWTGRQADLARQSVIRWNSLIADHRLLELI
jgi:thiamine kinase-like enzyme